MHGGGGREGGEGRGDTLSGDEADEGGEGGGERTEVGGWAAGGSGGSGGGGAGGDAAWGKHGQQAPMRRRAWLNAGRGKLTAP